MHRNLTRKTLVVVFVTAAAVFGQYKAAPAGAPPSEVPPAFASLLEKAGTQITDGSGKVVAEIWLVSSIKKGAKSAEENVTLPDIPHGTLLGVLRAPGTYNDRRGQVIKPGVYTLRYSMFPINGDHQGVAPQRDFFVLTKVSDDTDPNTNPNFDTLMASSRKASGTPHPLVLSIWKADDPKAGFAQQGDDWVLTHSAGDTALSIILVGKASA
jgi:hypothetical protein